MTLFVTGIGTGVGKTLATGLLARFLMGMGRRVLTAKLVQTGCQGIAEDIVTHRSLMGLPLLEEDLSGLTCPYVFEYAASPHLAAEREGRSIDPARLHEHIQELGRRCEVLLVEGAGGLAAPLTRDLTTADFLARERLPVLLVTTSLLGSLSATILTMEALAARSLESRGLVYNTGFPSPKPIEEDSGEFFRRRWPGVPLVRLGGWDEGSEGPVDFARLGL